jgi:hypothetical protein
MVTAAQNSFLCALVGVRLFGEGSAHPRLQAGIEAKGGRSGEHGFHAYPASGLLPHGWCADPGAGADGAGRVRHDAC